MLLCSVLIGVKCACLSTAHSGGHCTVLHCNLPSHTSTLIRLQLLRCDLRERRYRALMNFLSNVLREDGGFEYKRAIVDSILILIKDIPDAKEPGLAHLCEFIEVRSLWDSERLSLPCNALSALRNPAAWLRCCLKRQCCQAYLLHGQWYSAETLIKASGVQSESPEGIPAG